MMNNKLNRESPGQQKVNTIHDDAAQNFEKWKGCDQKE
jgi:hypothetical protein